MYGFLFEKQTDIAIKHMVNSRAEKEGARGLI